MAKIKNWIRIGTILNGVIAVFSALIAAGEIVLAIWGAQYARTSIPNDDMAFIPIIMRALEVVFSALAPLIAGMAGVVFVLSLIAWLLGRASLKNIRTCPTAGMILRIQWDGFYVMGSWRLDIC
jgi:hypothetical protein